MQKSCKFFKEKPRRPKTDNEKRIEVRINNVYNSIPFIQEPIARGELPCQTQLTLSNAT